MKTTYKNLVKKLQVLAEKYPQDEKEGFEGMQIETVAAKKINTKVIDIHHDYFGLYPVKAVWECEAGIEKLLNKYENVTYYHGGCETGTIVTIFEQN